MTNKNTADLEPKLKKPRSKRKDPRIEEEFYEDIEVTDPLTGKVIKQKVKITRYRAVGEKKVGVKGLSKEVEIELEESEYTWDESNF